MVLRETGAKLLIIIQMRMPIKDGRPRVNTTLHRPNIWTAQLRRQTFGRPNIERPRVKATLESLYQQMFE